MNHDPLENARRAIRDAEATFGSAPPQQASALLDALRALSDALAGVEAHASGLERRLATQQALLDDRLLRVEHNRLFTSWKRIAAFTSAIVRRVRTRQQQGLTPAGYNVWVAHEQSALPPMEVARATAETWGYPKISAVIAARNPALLEVTINSLQDQVYGDWEVCLAIHPGNESGIAAFEHLGPRLRYCVTLASGPPTPLNSAAQLATGDYLCFPAEGDTLSPYAFFYVANALQSADSDFLYSDEDHRDANGLRTRPVFKPDWSPDLLASCLYIGQLFAIRRDIFAALSGFRSRDDGAHVHDLALRSTTLDVRTCHIPRILYHAAGEAVPWAPVASEYSSMNTAPVGLTAVICSRSPRLLRTCLGALGSTAGDAVQRVIVVMHEENGPDAALRQVVREAGADGVPFTGVFNFAVMNNIAAGLVDTPGILFLNDDVIAHTGGWAAMLGAELLHEPIGAAGAVLRYPSGDLQHAGIVTGVGDGAGHIGRHMRSSPLWPWLEMRRNVSAVTGACLAIRTELFRDLSGFDPGFPNNYNDVDLCLRLRERGYEVVCVPVPGLVHAECQSREGVVHFEERYRFYEKWGPVLSRPDPYYSEALAPTETIALNVKGEYGFRSMLRGG